MNKNLIYILLLSVLIILIFCAISIGIFTYIDYSLKQNLNSDQISKPAIALDENQVKSGAEENSGNFKTYRNSKFNFEFQYPQDLSLEEQGPNLEQQKLDAGETISGTVQPSFETLSLTDSKNLEQFSLIIYDLYNKELTEENYSNDYLYLYGYCDTRWGFEPIEFEQKEINNLKILKINGKFEFEEGTSYRNCYYFKNNRNLFVISSGNPNDQTTLREIENIILNVLKSFKYL